MSEAVRLALDTNILVYASGMNDPVRMSRAKALLAALHPDDIVVPAQVLGELFNALMRKARLSGEEARLLVGRWRDDYRIAYADADVFNAALDLATDHSLQFWDALILATAADARCRLLLTEDLQDGFVFRGVTVANPFLEKLHPLLKDALER